MTKTGYVTRHCGPDDACVWRVVGFADCQGCTTISAPPAPEIRTAGYWQEKLGASGDLLYRYKCPCGHTGRWVRDGNLIEEAYEAHRFGDINGGPSRCRRR